MLPLLRTKTTIPPTSPRQIRRSRLLDRIKEGTRRALTLIVSPAGFGKTTLAAAWVAAAGFPVAWLSLQPADRSRERFLSYLIQALQTISPHLGQTTLALLQAGSHEGALAALVNDLANVETDFALVLDDYHSVDGPETAEILQFLLENRPAAFHLILLSRTAPALNLARLRALDQVTEISAADLRFNEDEVRAFFETSMDLHLPAQVLTRLNQFTEGWAVGLQLIALALVRQPESWQALVGQEYIFDYLAEEVLHREPPEVQDFLKITALFDRFCAPMCAHLSLSPELLAYVERANLFLVPLGSGWYRYHALFTDFLRRQLTPEQSGPIYRLASDWFEQNGLLDDAIHYAVHASDHERAAGLLEAHYRDMLQRGEQAVLTEWIESLPPALLEKHPRLWLARGWASIIALDSASALACAAQAEALIPAGETQDRLRGEARSLRVLSGIFAGQVAAANEISEAFVLLAEQDQFLHSLLHFNLGLHHVMLGETGRAVEAFTETLRLTSAFKLPLVTIIALVQLGETRQLRGALGLAERNFQQVIRYAKETLGEHTFLLGMPYISYADLLREQNRFDEAVRLAEQGIAYCQMWQPLASLDGQITLARLLAAQGQWERAFERLEGALQMAESSVSVLDDTFVSVQMARLALLQGDVSRAARLISAYEMEKTVEGAYYHLSELARLVLLRAEVARLLSDPAPALTLTSSVIEALSSLIAASEKRERVTPVIEALTLRSYALHAAGQHAETAESLSRALTLAAQGGYVRILADEGKPLLHLLEQYSPKIHAPRSYLDQILDLLRRETALSAPPEKPAPTAFPASAGLTPLTRRELEILALLATGKSNQEIAEECVLTLNTVKKHVANILSKLNVANRTQAVMLAKKLGWIEEK